ncbi:unnamed protein product [Mycena citricolor]|uniref:Uncharacterized protein n=1 Tax=Mycena citricolor TaxID=2018698 RepID=A0AAD2HLI1_9AGAR|nr:unnamed protein product [Mycena citricolor]
MTNPQQKTHKPNGLPLLTFCLSLAAAFLPAICAQSDNSTTFDWSALQATPNLTWVDCYGSIFQCTRLQVPFRALIGGEYDFYGFDPRGLDSRLPLRLFSAHRRRAQWNAGSFPPSLNSSSEAVKSKWGAAQIFGQLAGQRDTTGIFKYITTDNVARDMLYISQKAGYEKRVLRARTGRFSNKINRMIIDGVVDAEACQPHYRRNRHGQALQFFFTSCVSAGPEVCAFYKSTPETISARLEKLTNAVRAKPVPAVTRLALYTPYASFPVLAQGLANPNTGRVDHIGLSDLAAPLFQCTPADESAGDNGLDSGVGIECGDMAEVTDPIDQ